MVPFRFYLISDENRYLGSLSKLLPQLQKSHGLGIQIREKKLSPSDLYSLITTSQKQLNNKSIVYFYINDRSDIAVSTGSYGTHFREESYPLNRMHPFLRNYLSVGVSTHSIEGVQAAEKAGANFVTFGPVYETPSKSDYGRPLGLEALKEATNVSKIPVFALGGITLDRVISCIRAGAYGVSVISAVWGAPNPLEEIEKFQKQILLGVITRNHALNMN